jgi:hypothetical protein
MTMAAKLRDGPRDSLAELFHALFIALAQILCNSQVSSVKFLKTFNNNQLV